MRKAEIALKYGAPVNSRLPPITHTRPARRRERHVDQAKVGTRRSAKSFCPLKAKTCLAVVSVR